MKSVRERPVKILSHQTCHGKIVSSKVLGKDCFIKNVSERSELRYEVCDSDLMILSHQKCCLNHQTLKESAGGGG